MGSPKIKLRKHRARAAPPQIASGQTRGPGRPTKFTQSTRDTIIGAIRAGNYPDAAALYAGIDVRTFYRWMSRGELEEPGEAGEAGEAEEGGYRQFYQGVKRAEGVAEVGKLSIISRAAMGSPVEYVMNKAGELTYDKEGRPIVSREEKDPIWTAAAWQLERRSPEKFGRRLESTIKGIGPRGEIVVKHNHLVDFKKISDEDLHTLREIAVRTRALQTEEGEETIH